VETDIATQLAATYHVAPPPVRCPKAVPAHLGARFSCLTSLDGQSLTVTAEVTSARGAVTIKPAAAVIVMSAARGEIGAELERAVERELQGGPPLAVRVLSCATPGLVVARRGRAFTCTADLGGVARQVVVTVTSPAGALRLLLLPYKPT